MSGRSKGEGAWQAEDFTHSSCHITLSNVCTKSGRLCFTDVGDAADVLRREFALTNGSKLTTEAVPFDLLHSPAAVPAVIRQWGVCWRL